MEKVGVVGNDCGLPICLMGVCGDECHLAFIRVEDNLLGGAPFVDGNDRTL